MKSLLYILFLALLGSSVNAEAETLLSKELLAKKSQQLLDAQTSQAKKVTTTFASSARDPLSHSTILALNGYWTFVPKGAVIHVPSRFADRIVSKPQGKLIPFPKFLSKNYGWLQTRECKNSEILGDLENPEKFHESIQKCNCLLIATRQKKPVSTSLKIENIALTKN